MFGCCSRAIAWASSRNRRRASGERCGPAEDHLQGDRPVQFAVSGAVDDPHGPAAQLAQDRHSPPPREARRFRSGRAATPGGPSEPRVSHFLLELSRKRPPRGSSPEGSAPTARPGEATGAGPAGPEARRCSVSWQAAQPSTWASMRFRSASPNSSPRRRSRFSASGSLPYWISRSRADTKSHQS